MPSWPRALGGSSGGFGQHWGKPEQQGVRGNLDPRGLYASQAEIAEELEKYKPFFRENDKWIFNLAHGFLPDILYANAKFVAGCVESTKWKQLRHG
jgi:uroporphyrinogen-III decarboxylase